MNAAPSAPSWLEVNLAALRHNVRTVQDLAPGTEIAAVVKANGYGHGLVQIATTAVEAGAGRVCVSSFDEAEQLRTAGFAAPILMLGRAFGRDAERSLALDLAVTLSDEADVASFSAAAESASRPLPVHLNLESGIHRLGRSLDETVALAAAVRGASLLELEGVYSHFPSAGSDPAGTEGAFDTFVEAATQLDAPLRHIAATTALAHWPRMALEMARPGIGLYGVLPDVQGRPPAEVDLRPVLSWRARVLQVQHVAEGETVSYDGLWTAPRESRVAVLAAGYADGLRRGVSPGGWALLRGQRVPFVGTVCMDMTLVDVTDVADLQLDDMATLLGADGAERIRAEQMAGWAGTIAYEIFTGLGARLPRTYVDESPEDGAVAQRLTSPTS